jgi:hypothetical protein
MATLKQLIEYSISGLLGMDANRPFKFGDRADPTSLDIAGQVWDSNSFTVEDDFGEVDVWELNQGGMGTPKFILILSTADVWVELANTAAATDRRMMFQVRANALCVIPSEFMDGYVSNTSHFDGAALVGGTDYFNIQSLVVHNDAVEGAGDATVRVVLIK